MTRPESRVEAALEELCVRLGCCLRGDDANSIVNNPPADPDDFADRVILAEGLDPTLIDQSKRSEVVRVIRDWLFDDSGRGAKSGLPRYPLG